ncbi:MAG: hypothetical protein NTY50_00660 [Methylobacter sp.]|nr:hypothetical protein [Methylobacter sp.]
MALVSCRECNASVYELAKICPQCGAETPGTTHQQLRLKAEIESERLRLKSEIESTEGEIKQVERAEAEYERRYMNCGFIDRLLGEHSKYVNLARAANERRLELSSKKYDLESKLHSFKD